MSEIEHVVDAVAAGLAWISPEPVYVGGATIGLFLDALGRSQLRATLDVDCIVPSVVTRVAWWKLEEGLRARGWSPDPDGPICRYRSPGGVLVDLMSEDPGVLVLSRFAGAAHQRTQVVIGQSAAPPQVGQRSRPRQALDQQEHAVGHQQAGEGPRHRQALCVQVARRREIAQRAAAAQAELYPVQDGFDPVQLQEADLAVHAHQAGKAVLVALEDMGVVFHPLGRARCRLQQLVFQERGPVIAANNAYSIRHGCAVQHREWSGAEPHAL